MNILIAYDGSDESKSALELAKKHAKLFGATLFIISSSVGGKKEKAEKVSKINDKIEKIREELKKSKIPTIEEQLARGLSPGEDILQYSEDKKIDMIYIGIRKKSKTAKILLGSTAQYIILRSKIPVVSVKY